MDDTACLILMSLVPSFDYRSNGQQEHKIGTNCHYGFLSVLYLKVRQLIMQNFIHSLVTTASLHPKGTSLSKTENRVEFVNLKNLHLVIIPCLPHDSEMSVLLRTASSFV